MALLIFIGVPLLVGLGVSLAIARTAARSLLATTAGVLGVGVLLAIAFFTAPTSAADAFHDQGEYAGRWLDPVIFLTAIFAIGAWFVGVLFGSLFRREDRGEPAARVYGALSWMLVAVAAITLWAVAQS
jgi:hypothetical protein